MIRNKFSRKKEENGFHSLANAPDQTLVSTKTEDTKPNVFKYLSVEKAALTELGSHSLVIALDSGSSVLRRHAGSNSLRNEMNLPPPASKSNIKNSFKNNSIKNKITLIFSLLILLIFTNIAYADLYLNSRTGSAFLNTSDIGRIQINPGGNVIVLGLGNTTLPANLSVAGNTLFVDNTTSRVGIGIKTPNQKLHVIGNVNISGDLIVMGSIYGILGAGNITGTLLDAQVANDLTIQTTSDLTVGGGYSGGGITLIASGANKGTGQFAKDVLVDGQIVAVNDIEINESFIPVRDAFERLGNASNRFLDLYVLNIKGNETIIMDANVTIRGNLTVDTNASVLGNLIVDSNTLFVDSVNNRVGIGTVNPNDALEVIGNVRVSGSLNATSINATFFKQGTKDVASVGDFNLGNISNYSQFIKGADFSVSGNISNYTQYIHQKDFNLGNISNATVSKGDNATSALWNRTGNNIYPREITGNVGIGTTVPQQKLTLANASNFTIDMGAVTGIAAAGDNVTNGLNSGTYYYKITALDGAGETIASEETSITLNINNAGNRTNLSWSAVTGASSYRVYNASSSNGQASYFTITDTNFTHSNQAFSGEASTPTVTTAYVNKISASGNSWILGGNVGIGDTTPSDALEVVGNVRISRSLNATSINATFFKQGTKDVASVGDFNLGNISNYSQFIKGADFSVSGNISNYTQYIHQKDFNLGNISNHSNFPLSRFTLENVSNNTLVKGDNVSLALFNSSSGKYIFPRDSALLIRIGNFTSALENDTFTVSGSSAFYGSLNSTSFNATYITQGTNQVQTVNAVYNLANFTTNYDNRADRFGNANFSTRIDTYIGAFFNNANFSTRIDTYIGAFFNNGNFSTRLDLYIPAFFNKANFSAVFDTYNGALFNKQNASTLSFSNFQLANVSNNTLVKGDNASLALWNLSSLNSAKRFILSHDLVRIGNFTTAQENDTFAVTGSVAVYGSLNATFINASNIFIGTKAVQTGADFNLGNISNYSQFIKGADFSVSGNISNYTQYIHQKDFNLGNISNATLVKGDNVTLALWNRTGNNIYPREITGNVGIGTTVPQQKLTLANASNFTIDMGAVTGIVAAGDNVTNGLNSGTYYYKITALDGAGETIASEEVSITLNINNAGNRTNLSWSAVTGASSYRVYNASSSNGQASYFTITDTNFTHSNQAFSGEASTPTVTTAYVNKISASGNSWLLGGNVGIGDTTPSDALEVVGNVRVSGSLNATSINATFFKQGTKDVASVGDFNLGNISNASVVKGDNVTLALWNLSFSKYIFPSNSEFAVRIGNITNLEAINYINDTLVIEGSSAFYGSLNASFINATEIRQGANQVQTINAVYNLANFTTNYDNRADRFGNANFSTRIDTYIGAFFNNANFSSRIDTYIGAFFNNANFSVRLDTYMPAFWNRANTTDYLGGVNGSIVLSTNTTLFNSFSKFTLENVSNSSNTKLNNGSSANFTSVTIFGLLNATKLNGTISCNMINDGTDSNFCVDATGASGDTSNFQLSNVSNNTLVKGDNASLALWNLSSLNSAKRFILSHDLVRIGNFTTAQENDTFTVTGTVAIYGFLNATIINSTRFIQNNKDVASVGDFSIGNISNLTKTSSFSILLGNFTIVNSSNISATNITATRFTGALDCGMLTGGSDTDFCADGGGGDSSNFQLSNVSNNTLVKGDNASLALWNFTRFQDSIMFPRFRELLVRIGGPFTNISNDTFAVIGSAAVYGSLNATTFNATKIISGNITIGTSGEPVTQFYIDTSDSNRAKINNSVYIAGLLNATNITATSINATNIFVMGNVGIGTGAPNQALHVSGGNVNVSSGNISVAGAVVANGTTLGGPVPANVVIFTTDTSCPTGYTEYTTARGRYIVGLPLSGAINASVGTALTDSENRVTGAHTHTKTFGHVTDDGAGNNIDLTGSVPDISMAFGDVTGGATAGTNAPYVQLLACKKT